MHLVLKGLWLAGIIQLVMFLANVYIPSKLRYRENLARVTPIVKQVFVSHAIYVAGVMLLFAILTLGWPGELASGHGLGRFLAAAMSIFWLCRVPMQLFYFDKILRRSNRIADVAMTAALIFLAAVYGAAALAPVF